MSYSKSLLVDNQTEQSYKNILEEVTVSWRRMTSFDLYIWESEFSSRKEKLIGVHQIKRLNWQGNKVGAVDFETNDKPISACTQRLDLSFTCYFWCKHATMHSNSKHSISISSSMRCTKVLQNYPKIKCFQKCCSNYVQNKKMNPRWKYQLSKNGIGIQSSIIHDSHHMSAIYLAFC